jgi:hypothetical protein
MKNKRFLTRVLPLIILLVVFLVYLFIFRDNYTQGVVDAVNNFK